MNPAIALSVFVAVIGRARRWGWNIKSRASHYSDRFALEFPAFFRFLFDAVAVGRIQLDT